MNYRSQYTGRPTRRITSHGQKWWTLTAVAAGLFMLQPDATIVNVVLPRIQKAFGASLPDLQWVIDAYALPGRRRTATT